MSPLPTAIVTGLFLLLAACGGGSRPVPVDTKNDTCAFCRMAVSNPRVAAQIVGPGEEPRFFDDIGCLASYLRTGSLSTTEVVYVADHRTGEWVDADHAMFSRIPATATPMGSGLIAHASQASREQDATARNSVPVSRDAAIGSSSLKGGG